MAEKLTQEELIKVMREACGETTTKAGMERAFKALFTKIGDEMVEGRSVTIQKFGTFSTIETKERTGRNPRTNEPLTIPAGRKPKFAASATLKARFK